MKNTKLEKDYLREFIERKEREIINQGEPQRQGIRKGDKIGFSVAKQRAALWCITALSLREVAAKADCSYNVLATWKTQEQFKKTVSSFALDFVHYLLPLIEESKQFYFQACENWIKDNMLSFKDYPKAKNFLPVLYPKQGLPWGKKIRFYYPIDEAPIRDVFDKTELLEWIYSHEYVLSNEEYEEDEGGIEDKVIFQYTDACEKLLDSNYHLGKLERYFVFHAAYILKMVST